jgi:lipoprotein signal peptidase
MKLSEKITSIIGVTLVSVFVIGLAWSISTGLAGFWRGLPFWVIVIFSLYLIIVDARNSINKS